MHAITHAQYLQIRDERYTVLSFDRATKERRRTYGGLSLLDAVREIQKMQAHGCICLLFAGHVAHPQDAPHKGWHFDDYEELLK